MLIWTFAWRPRARPQRAVIPQLSATSQSPTWIAGGHFSLSLLTFPSLSKETLFLISFWPRAKYSWCTRNERRLRSDPHGVPGFLWTRDWNERCWQTKGLDVRKQVFKLQEKDIRHFMNWVLIAVTLNLPHVAQSSGEHWLVELVWLRYNLNKLNVQIVNIQHLRPPPPLHRNLFRNFIYCN